MSRVFHHYEKWEDFHSGLYKIENCTEEKINGCVELLSNVEELYFYMKKCIDEWNYARDQQMTNPSRNKQAWLGQAACCMKLGVNEDNVKEAWRRLTEQQRTEANKIADLVIDYYKTKYGTKIS